MPRSFLEYHPVLGYRFIPNLKARVPHESGGYLIRVNNFGFRCNHNFSIKKEKNNRRVLLFGDSYTAGDGVSNEFRYGDLLEQLVPNLEVYNFGLPGSGTDQQYLAYREFAANIEHDLVIIAVLVENIRRVASHYRVWHNEQGQLVCYAKPYFVMNRGVLTPMNIPPRKDPIPSVELPDEEKEFLDYGSRFPKIEKLIAKLHLKDFAQSITRYQPVPEYNRPGNPAWQLMQNILKEWIRNEPKPVLIMPLPVYQYLEGMSNPSYYQARFNELAHDTGCLLYDLLPDLLKYSLEQRRQFRFKKDAHPTREGHAAIANCLAPILEKSFNKTERQIA